MVSQISDEAPTGPISGPPGPAQQTPRARIARAAGPGAGRRGNLAADLTGVVLVVVALFLPWNLYFGLGIPDSNTTVFVVLLGVTLLSVVAFAVAGSWRSGGAPLNPRTAGLIRLLLNVPYLTLVLAFVAFDAAQTVRFGGTVAIPGGVGPGAWVGAAGALLGAQAPSTGAHAGPLPAGEERTGWHATARVTGYVSMLAAALSFGFNLYWRVRYALQSPNGAGDFGKQNIAVIATAVVYGVVALAAVLVASRWLLRGTRAAQLATVALGSSALVAGVVVWVLPVGRDLDAFHGIAQNTSTAGVGFEGYLAWAAGAAIFTRGALLGARTAAPAEEAAWRAAARHGLLLIGVWSVGSMLMRITDLLVGISLHYPFSRYDSVVLAGFDLVTAALSLWVRARLAHASARPVAALCGLVATLGVARVVVGVALAPRFADSPNSPEQHPVYGNNLAQQITSTFDLTLVGVALGVVAATLVAGRLSGRRRNRRARPAAGRPGGRPGARPVPPRNRVPVGRQAAPPSAAATTRIPTAPPGADDGPATSEIPPLAAAPRIFRGDDSATGQIPIQQPGPQPKIFRPPQA